ncbi:Fanconi anemia core complex-associated protein 24-like isoform X2 [Limulus polyphemus]|uniref:Fanconi anemia core complex-associated protein 24-like isoform X2 n=1 Tax=Limulus polyphemus TaxID=6850 RepID=A0ABM1BSG2_LIMPO|nr:Fanconi anemia core complex-associated protein 24-like isoform X2 [Limulus polyphemus]
MNSQYMSMKMAVNSNPHHKIDACSFSKNDSSQMTQTPVKKDILVPHGHIIISYKWRGTELAKALEKGVKVIISEQLGVVDFHPSSDVAVAYVSEVDIIAGTSFRRKLVKMRQADCMRGVVIVEKTPYTTQQFYSLQKFTVLELGLTLIPIANSSEAGQLLIQMVHAENRESCNPFRLKRQIPPMEVLLVRTLTCIPSLGDVKARALLQKFHCK